VHGYARGACECTQCPQYIYVSTKGNDCDYCGHKPIQHSQKKCNATSCSCQCLQIKTDPNVCDYCDHKLTDHYEDTSNVGKSDPIKSIGGGSNSQQTCHYPGCTKPAFSGSSFCSKTHSSSLPSNSSGTQTMCKKSGCTKAVYSGKKLLWKSSCKRRWCTLILLLFSFITRNKL